MWTTGKADLLRGEVDVDTVPDATSKRWGVSAILRLPVQLVESINEIVTQIRAYTGEGHTFYDPTTLHVTLRSIEYFRVDLNQDDKMVSTYAQLLKQAASAFPELSVNFKGLSANRIGIIIQGFPLTDQLQLLRQRFHQLLDQHGLLGGPEQHQPRLNAHASLVVYGVPFLEDKEALTSYIDQHRFTNYGQMSASHIDLVRYERQVDSVNIITLDQIPLNAT
jgi:2'-5' RNA ligase